MSACGTRPPAATAYVVVAEGGSMSCGVVDREKESRFTAEYVRSRLHYNPDTGDFIWLVPAKRGKKRPGDRAGYALGGKYIRICLDMEHLYGHRLAWLVMTGNWPRDEVDHRDLNGLNNKWSNLREATRQQNSANSKIFKTNSLGVKGVRWCKGAFVAQISVNNKTVHLGRFPTVEAAHEAYLAAAKKLHGEFARAK